jgi:hypothetical protein
MCETQHGWYGHKDEFARGGFVSTALIKQPPKVLEISHTRDVTVVVWVGESDKRVEEGGVGNVRRVV